MGTFSQDELCGQQKADDAIENQEVEQEAESEERICDPNPESEAGMVEVEDKKNV